MSKPLHSPEYVHFLEELRGARERVNLSQIELAERIGEHQTFVSKCERGIRRLDIVELKRWTDALGIGLVRFSKTLDQRLERNRALTTLRRPNRSPTKPRK
jgi:transcriptional regulator with XRE-family HTH domain